MRERYFCFTILFSFLVNAQETAIDTVIIDQQFSKTELFSKIQKISSKEIFKNSLSLSDLLQYQTPIYIKENGRGMVSSPSFRGTTAQQTAFVWNGISINSQFLGQGDINNIPMLGYDHISIKYGGGSILYGSGAIGGSIHLNNAVSYNNGLKNQVFTEYGSFDTFNSLLKSQYSNDKLSADFSVSHNQSRNFFEVKEVYYTNRNASYDNTSINIGLGYRFNFKNEIIAQSQLFNAEQNYPILSEFGTPTKYNSQTFRTLLGWNLKSKGFKNVFKIAYLTDDYQFFMNSNDPASKSGGGTKQYLAKNELSYNITSKSAINFNGEISKIEALGNKTGINEVSRFQGSAALLYRNSTVRNLNWEIGLKKEMIEDVTSPILYSAAINFQPTSISTTKLSFSKNFRSPSFNDLYWQPGGNPDLKPELSHQIEFSQELKGKIISASITPYFIDIKDMIRWTPGSGGLWKAINTTHVRSLGFETQIKAEQHWNNFSYKTALSYAYTQSEDQKLKKQLPYVPQHKVNLIGNFKYKTVQLDIQSIWNSKIFTDSEESTQYSINSFYVINLGLSTDLLKFATIGLKVNNITSEIYRTTMGYYMPKRNYAVNMNFKF